MGLEFPEGELRRTMRRLELPKWGHCPQLDVVWCVGNQVLRKRSIRELDREEIAIEPHRRTLSRNALLAIQPPMTEANVTQRIEPPPKPCRVEDAMVPFLGMLRTGHPSKDFGRAVSPVFPLPMRPMDLGVEVLEPTIMDCEDVLPGSGTSEVPIGHPPLHSELALNVGLPCLALVDLFLANAEGLVDRHRPVCLEDRTAI